MVVATEAIAVRHLSKAYATRDGTVVALDKITFGVAEGEFVAVVGPSGCGKSTLLKILAGILPASSGEAWGIIKEKVNPRDLVTNELIDEINRFDAVKVTAEAKGWK